MFVKIRSIYFYLFVFSLMLLAASFFLQFGLHLTPCPLCIIDRFIVFILTLFFAFAFWRDPAGNKKRYSLIGFGLALLGIIVTTRHLWLIHLPPDQVPDCGPGFNYLIANLSPKEALFVILNGSGECAKNKSTFWGLTLPAWTLIAFIIVAVGSLVPWVKRK